MKSSSIGHEKSRILSCSTCPIGEALVALGGWSTNVDGISSANAIRSFYMGLK